MQTKNCKYYMCDFETTVYDGQEDTQVWAAAICELFTEDAVITHSLGEMLNFFRAQNSNIICWFHNLKFDGEFIIWYLLNELKLKQAIQEDKDGTPHFLTKKEMPRNTFSYSISAKGLWYKILIRLGYYFVEIRDSLKLMPFSVKDIGEGFKTKHRKLEMEYKGFRYPGCEIKPDEQEYIKNDIYVPKEGLEYMINEGHDKLTIGACCMAEFKKILKTTTAYEYDELFPNLFEIPLNSADYRYETVGKYILKSYKGAFCHLVKGKEKRIFKNGHTFDVNSLYPYVMHSDSGNEYPIGKPKFWKGDYIPEEARLPHRYFFIRCKTRFYLKPGKLPYIQIKGNGFYKGTDHLETSDIWSKKNECYCQYYEDKDGSIKPAIVELSLTMTDYEIIKQQYDLVDFEILDGCWFYTEIGLFDNYIDKYKKIKMASKGAKRSSAKLFSNNLYGKFASSTDSSYKVIYPKEDGSLGFKIIEEHDKTPGYIPVGSAITSYARAYTFRIAQQNYYGPNKPGFIYADTDSIHIDLPLDKINGIKQDPVIYGCWKCEATWDIGWFVRQKTYIEHIVEEDLESCKPFYNIKCAGMPEKCKKLFELSIKGKENFDNLEQKEKDKLEENQLEFLFEKNSSWIERSIEDFNLGLKVPGKLFPTHIKGGVLLVEGNYTMN